MILTYPKTFVILNEPVQMNHKVYVVMDMDGCHFTRREYRDICHSPYATFITEELYNYNQEQTQYQPADQYQEQVEYSTYLTGNYCS